VSSQNFVDLDLRVVATRRRDDFAGIERIVVMKVKRSKEKITCLEGNVIGERKWWGKEYLPPTTHLSHWAKPDPMADKSQEIPWDFRLGLEALDARWRTLSVPLGHSPGKNFVLPLIKFEIQL
jgi:hypothetical protein